MQEIVGCGGLEQIAMDLAREPRYSKHRNRGDRSPMSGIFLIMSIRHPVGVPIPTELAAAGFPRVGASHARIAKLLRDDWHRLLKGRLFTDADRSGAPTDYFVKEPYRAAIISASMAKVLWPEENPIGSALSSDGWTRASL